MTDYRFEEATTVEELGQMIDQFNTDLAVAVGGDPISDEFKKTMTGEGIKSQFGILDEGGIIAFVDRREMLDKPNDFEINIMVRSVHVNSNGEIVRFIS